MNVAAIIVGIDGWEKYTLPLVESIRKHEPKCKVVVIDNGSKEPYPRGTSARIGEMACYSAAINYGKYLLNQDEEAESPDWYIVLSNDVLCTGPFADILEYGYDDSSVVGPALKETHGFPYIEGWAVAIPRRIWDACGGWDERFLGSDWEDVAFSTKARQKGYYLTEDLPFKHLDQRQRYTIVDDFWGKDAHNRDLFLREYAAVTA
jgi:GT2 family glycosyltransferase